MRYVLCCFLLCLFSFAGADVRAEDAFPAGGMQPKSETGADRFLQEHPDFDGRGIVIAIFDTGVDPGAPGLQVTTDGKPKIIDLVDGSGSGDVDTSKVCEATDGKIEGLSGKTLTVGAHTAPTNKWHVGLKPAYDFFPGGLVNRLSKKRKQGWDEQQRKAEAKLAAAIDRLRDSDKKPDKILSKDLKSRLKQLRALQAAYKDPGPIYDCVVFHDGTTWRALIDTDEDGDLGDEKALANFREERQYSTFSDEDRLNYGVNIYEEGKLLSIVVDCGAHGTHVAGMAAAHVPGKPELDGIAPGAQIVSVKIGDTRMGSASMSTGEERGLIAVLRNKCDLINMSYGGPDATPNRGHQEQLYTEIVNKHGVIFVASAGNEGPALSTTGTPGGTTTAIFGVGAYVSPAMQKAQYAMRKTVPGVHFTWSSRGPTPDGNLGVDFSAPGGAIAPVPNWNLQGRTQMNGTSMSSPSLCGGVALLLSGLKAKGISWSPIRLYRALAATARKVQDIEVFALGHGLIQLPEAFDHLVEWKDAPAADARFRVTLPDRGGARGLYLREPYETERVLETRVRVKPAFREDENHDKRIGLSVRVALESTAPWIECADHMLLLHGGESMRVRVDPTKLAPGVHYEEIRGYDSTARGRGPLFRVPVTVIKPIDPPDDGHGWSETLSFKPGQIERRFFTVPHGATWANLHVRTSSKDEERLLVVHAQQLLPGRHFKATNFEAWLRMGHDAEAVRSFAVEGGRTLELCLAQYWSSLGAGTFDLELAFHGVEPSSRILRIDPSSLFSYVDVSAPVRRERIKPRAKLTRLRKRVRPKEYAVRPLDRVRDTLPDARRIHEMILTYAFELKEKANVQPLGLNADDLGLAEEWSSNLWQLFDENKRRVANGPLWDKTVPLKKGKYVLRLHLRHENVKKLESVKDALLNLDIELDDSISLSVHADAMAALGGRGGFDARSLEHDEVARVYVRAPAPKALPEMAEPGDELHGTITYGEADSKRSGTGRRPKGYPVWYLVPAKPAKSEPEKTEEEEDEAEPKPSLTDVDEAVRDLEVEKLAVLRKAKAFDDFDKLAARILAKHKGHVPVLVEQMKRVEKPEAVIPAADRVLARLNGDRIAAYFGRKQEPKKRAEKKKHKRMEMLKEALTDALFHKAKAQSEMGEPAQAAFRATFKQLGTWTDTKKGRYLELEVAHERARGRLGAALEMLQAQMKKGPAKQQLHAQRAKLFEALGWTHWAAHERTSMALRFPPGYPPF